MPQSGAPRPRVSRETRLLLATVLLSLAALWVLARIRFPDRPATASPVPPLLTQLARQPAFEELSSEIFQLEPRILPALRALEVERHDSHGGATGRDVVAALRFRDSLAVALIGTGATRLDGGRLVALDPLSGLALVDVVVTGENLVPWIPQRLQYPRYLMAADASAAGVSLRPVFIGPLRPAESPVWAGSVWVIPAEAGLRPGSFVFTTTGAVAGLAARDAGRTVIVPVETMAAVAERLLTAEPRVIGTIGVRVQPLTPAIGAAAGVASGLVVSRVDPESPAAGKLLATDIVQTIGGQPVASLEEWRARTSLLRVGETIVLGVWRRRAIKQIEVTAVEPAAPPVRATLGVTLRSSPGAGAEVTRVEPDSPATTAGLRAGDVITSLDGVGAPSPQQILRAFRELPAGEALLAALTRGDEHLVVALVKH